MTISYKISKEEFLEFVKNEPKTFQQVREHFKVSVPLIYRFLKRHNLPKNILSRQNCKITKEEFLEFVKNEPKTRKELAKHFEVTKQTIYKFLKRHNLPLGILCKRIVISKEEFLEFTKNQPKTMRQVRKHFKVSAPLIYRFLKKHNLPKNILSRQKKTILTIKN